MAPSSWIPKNPKEEAYDVDAVGHQQSDTNAGAAAEPGQN
jgi:hypothetical protein